MESKSELMNRYLDKSFVDYIKSLSYLEYYEFLINNYKENLENRYNITISQNENGEYDLEEVITEIAKKVGALLSGNNINEEKVSNVILRDFRTGKLGRISLEKPEKEELI